ncbi:uncharacterized protein LOC125661707 [Ostrea edulis]|uniref:uncharacterized protein LOC125661707 n=1 Tax=Ostrea edulis TaxID=37623 RepID=UPI0024AF79E5|nr:uncharacterized protein LOC125661707 [Ostrea edulis]XP_048749794.2 uncharacterized protein LOC125661707 [Ostrea edulis]XP_056002141.1 uncharacterized protein LOC125661707 [Ostrea edulis]
MARQIIFPKSPGGKSSSSTDSYAMKESNFGDWGVGGTPSSDRRVTSMDYRIMLPLLPFPSEPFFLPGQMWQSRLMLDRRSFQTQNPKYQEETCRCLRNIIRRTQTCKMFQRLDAIETFLDAFVLKLEFKGFPITLPKPKTCSQYKTYEDINMETPATEKSPTACKACIHQVKSVESAYFECDFRQKIKLAATRGDVWYIKSLLNFTSPGIMRNICGELCSERPDTDFCTKVIVDTIRNKFLKLYKEKLKIVLIWTGYRVTNSYRITRGIDTIVVITESTTKNKLSDTFWGLDLVIRTKDECDKEAERLLIHENFEVDSFQHNSVDFKKIENIFQCHSNVTLINTSSVRSKGYHTKSRKVVKTPTIVIHCQVKGVVPVGEGIFPQIIDDLPVDVREGVCHFAGKALRFSEEIRTENVQKTGTVGCFLDLENPKRKALLTCAHVVLPTNILKENKSAEYIRRQEVCVLDKEGKKIGEVEDTVFTHGDPTATSVDAALVEITDRRPCDGSFADVYSLNQLVAAGFSVQDPPHFSNGQIDLISGHNFRKPILKVGAASGITLGSLKIGRSSAQIIDDVDMNVDNSFRIRVFGQLEVIPRIDPSQPPDTTQCFLNDGDSGAIVFAITSETPLVLKCIGMAIAKTSYGSCLLTPIDKIFDELNIPYNSLSTFSVPRGVLDNDSDGLRNLISMISQQLTEVKSTMDANVQDTKKDREEIKAELGKINDRLSTAESEILSIKKGGQ